jgi:hypothetical protein
MSLLRDEELGSDIIAFPVYLTNRVRVSVLSRSAKPNPIKALPRFLIFFD